MFRHTTTITSSLGTRLVTATTAHPNDYLRVNTNHNAGACIVVYRTGHTNCRHRRATLSLRSHGYSLGLTHLRGTNVANIHAISNSTYRLSRILASFSTVLNRPIGFSAIFVSTPYSNAKAVHHRPRVP